VAPASSDLNKVSGAANALPASLVVAIALLAGLGAVGGAVAARRRWPVIVRAPLRLIRR
jgi:VIT1/CCC1 family predicted Fe2+/Mn2+ transporter